MDKIWHVHVRHTMVLLTKALSDTKIIAVKETTQPPLVVTDDSNRNESIQFKRCKFTGV